EKLESRLNEMEVMKNTKLEHLKNYIEKNEKLSVYLFMSSVIHTGYVYSIDYLAIEDRQLACSGSSDKKSCLFDINDDKYNLSSSLHLGAVYCVKFSQYYYNINKQN
ncbi:hypothetical protein RFI_33323, partial [Reticulomyxa filosa]